jgi:hypothetical protein
MDLPAERDAQTREVSELDATTAMTLVVCLRTDVLPDFRNGLRPNLASRRHRADKAEASRR